MTNDAEKSKWRTKLRTLNKDHRYQLIADAHDVGGLSYNEIAEETELSRIRVIQIVKKVRDEREAQK